MMRKATLLALILTFLFSSLTLSQETYFGKNKVRYKDFEWSYIQTRHFDIHYYEEAYPIAKFAAAVMESSYVAISTELNYKIQKRIPVFLYNSQNDFQQTNIISGLLPEGVGGFTTVSKNRIVAPFNGSYEDFRHVLHHELTHAVTFDMLYGNLFTSLLSQRRLFDMPLWFAEGYAEYSSRGQWDYFTDMFIRDATINNYLIPPDYLSGYMAYRQGQAMVKYIADKYGEHKLGEFLQRGKHLLSANKALKAALGVEMNEFWEDFSKEMKRRYWPDIAIRKEADEIAKQLTHAREDNSYFNEKPAFSPEGDKIAIFTDVSDYTEIILISALDGTRIKKLVKSERSADIESLHSYVSGISFSPDATKIVFVAKSKGKESLMFYSLDKDKVYKKKRTKFHNIISPAWSPDGDKIAFSALDRHKRDIYIYDLKRDEFEQVTDDRFDDVEPSWMPDSRTIVFSSDRPHPQNPPDNFLGHSYLKAVAVNPGDFQYGIYNIFKVAQDIHRVTPIDVGPGPNKNPIVAPNGKKIAFISNRNGIDNIYIGYLDSLKNYAVTDLLSGVRSISWGPNSDKIAFSAFYQGSFDIFVLDKLVPAGNNGVLTPTDFVLGKYAPPGYEKEPPPTKPAEDTVLIAAVTDTTATIPGMEIDYETYPLTVDSTVVEADSTDLPADTTLAGTVGDTAITETGTYDDEYVFVSEKKSDPLDSLLINLPNDSSAFLAGQEEPPSFDSIAPALPSGEFAIKKYKVKFTPDYMGGGFMYDTFFGLQGQSYFVFSDYLGNHQILVATDLVNTIDQSNIQAYYLNYKNRINLGAGLFHTNNYYLDNDDHLFSDRFYGLQLFFRRPFSLFSRLELTTAQYFIDRKYHDYDDPRENRSSKVTKATFAYVTDNILWGNTGPVNGRRGKLSLEGGKNLFDDQDIEFYSVDFDYRKYWHWSKTFTFAFRMSGGASFGNTPKLYFLGGTTNWIGTRTLDDKVYNVENLYFAEVVTPLRGIPYYELSGNRYGLVNLEFRFPMIQYFAMRYPLPIVLGNINGAIFYDMGSAWYDDDFKGGTSQNGSSRLVDIKTGFGFGMRANLFGFLLLRYDLAWATDFNSVSDKPTYYFSFGADF
ncbi:MAG: PD40 domain-containing protein [candidate division Zixibacteria bacterium]|nr:PD40 domain-containing protein [candidate division Zixibacteria bacterium]